jgi:hypothetical protein
MSKGTIILTALLVSALAASIASAAPKKKKKPKVHAPAAAATVAPPAESTSPPDMPPPATSALDRVEKSIAAYSPKEAPPPVITARKDEPIATTTLTSAQAPSAEAPAPRPASRGALGEGFSLAPVADYGTSKVYGVGVGLRFGYTHSSRVYLGATFLNHFGGSNGLLSYNLYYYGPEVGYDLPFGPVVVRPYVGGGVGSLKTTYRGTGVIPGSGGVAVPGDFYGRSQTPFFWPGATIFVPLGNALALGADVRVLLAPGQDASTSTLSNNGSLAFPNSGGSSSSSTALAAGLVASYRF